MVDVNTDFDVIVVGSGATGGLAARELTARGLKVLVLERGKPLEHQKGYRFEHVPAWQIENRNLPDRALFERDYAVQRNARNFETPTREWWNNDRLNPYAQAPGKPFNWFRTNVVGGKSLMWGRHVYRWSDLDFQANARDGHGIPWPVGYADVAPWYSHVEKYIGVSGRAEGLPHLPDGEFQPPMELNVVEQTFGERLKKAYDGRRMITIGRVANITEPLRERAPCHYCGPCHRGCTAGAYYSSLSVSLPDARATGRLTLRANSVVESLEYDAAKKRVVAVRVIDAVNKTRHRFTSRAVFMCASTFATDQVLLNSRSDAFATGLGNSSGMLGRCIMDHYHGGGAYGAMPGFESKYYYGNRPNTVYLPRFRNLDGQESGLDFVRGYGFQGMAFPEDWATAWVSKPGFGADFKNAMRTPGRWTMFLLAFGEALPNPDNRVVLDRALDRYGIPQLRFEFAYGENERRMGDDIVRETQAMLAAGGATDIVPLTQPFVAGTSIHEFGGACMGADPAKSVVNARSQLHDAPNVFVTDGAAMSSASCVNPTLTFMAFTARAAEYAATRLAERSL